MSHKSPEVGGKAKRRRKTQERSDSTTSRDSGKSLERDGKGDPFRSGKEFAEKANRVAVKDWVGDLEPLIAQMEEQTVAINMVIRSDKFCARCKVLANGATSLATHHLEEAGNALRGYSHRYQQALKDLNKERRAKEALAEESEEWMERGDRLIDKNEMLMEEKEGWSTVAKKVEEERKELEERLRRMVEERKELEREMKEIAAKSEDRKERLGRKNEKIQELELERDQLRAALATREEGGGEGGLLLLLQGTLSRRGWSWEGRSPPPPRGGHHPGHTRGTGGMV